MKQGFGLTAVLCGACQTVVSLQPPPFVETVEAVEETAKKVMADGHIQNKALCTDTSQMTILFVLAMAPDDKPLVQITGLNGKAATEH